MRNQKFEIVELPPDGALIYYHPGVTTERGHDGLLFRVLPLNAESWICMVEDRFGCEVPGPFMMPDGKKIFANGYLLSCADPKDWSEMAVCPVRGARWTPAGDIVVFHSYSTAAAYGRRGLMWERNLVTDDLKILAISDTVVRVDGFLQDDELIVDLQNGQIIEDWPSEETS